MFGSFVQSCSEAVKSTCERVAKPDSNSQMQNHVFCGARLTLVLLKSGIFVTLKCKTFIDWQRNSHQMCGGISLVFCKQHKPCKAKSFIVIGSSPHKERWACNPIFIRVPYNGTRDGKLTLIAPGPWVEPGQGEGARNCRSLLLGKSSTFGLDARRCFDLCPFDKSPVLCHIITVFEPQNDCWPPVTPSEMFCSSPHAVRKKPGSLSVRRACWRPSPAFLTQIMVSHSAPIVRGNGNESPKVESCFSSGVRALRVPGDAHTVHSGTKL